VFLTPDFYFDLVRFSVFTFCAARLLICYGIITLRAVTCRTLKLGIGVSAVLVHLLQLLNNLIVDRLDRA
jgi:hypothetical protein